MKTQYLGNGCLEVAWDGSTLCFNSYRATTSIVVSEIKYTLISGILINQTDWNIDKQTYHEREESQILNIQLGQNETCIIQAEILNQYSTYIELSNNNGKLTYEVIAEECFYLLDQFHGTIRDREVSEEEYRGYEKFLCLHMM